MKRIIILFCLMSASGTFTHSQDTIPKSTINLPCFEVITAEIKYIKKWNNNIDSVLTESEYTDGKSITPVNEFSFRMTCGSGENVLKYEDIQKITFIKDKSKFLKGVWQGAVCGAVIGLIGIVTSDKKERNTMWLGIPIFALMGSVTGGIIGAFLKESEEYDFTNYRPERRKQKALSIFIKYKVNF